MSQSSCKKTKEKSDKAKADNFVWTDDEVQLLLQVTNEYKVSKVSKSIDWESCQSKYTDILELFREHYPSSNEESEEIDKEYPHKKEEITKVILTTKLKNIRVKFRQAIDSGRRSGHGRVVLLYFELCLSIWGGSPATNTILSGIETGEVEGSSDSISIDPDSPGSPESQYLNTSETSDPPSTPDLTSVEPTSQPQTTNDRRNLLDAKLKGYKTEKLKRKLPAESQFLHLAQEELTIKKQLIEKMNVMDNEYLQNMNRLSSNMEKLSSSIADGFAMLRQLMVQPYGMPHAPPAQTYQGYSMYPHPASSVGRHLSTASTSNQSESNSGHFSYTQSLFSNDGFNDYQH